MWGGGNVCAFVVCVGGVCACVRCVDLKKQGQLLKHTVVVTNVTRVLLLLTRKELALFYPLGNNSSPNVSNSFQFS